MVETRMKIKFKKCQEKVPGTSSYLFSKKSRLQNRVIHRFQTLLLLTFCYGNLVKVSGCTCVAEDLAVVWGDLPDEGGDGQVQGLLVALRPARHLGQVIHLQDTVLVPPAAGHTLKTFLHASTTREAPNSQPSC